jgi:hypothetical protein
MIDRLANGIDMRDVVDEVPLAEVNRDLAVETGLLEDASGLPPIDTIYSVHRADLGPGTGL